MAGNNQAWFYLKQCSVFPLPRNVSEVHIFCNLKNAIIANLRISLRRRHIFHTGGSVSTSVHRIVTVSVAAGILLKIKIPFSTPEEYPQLPSSTVKSNC